MVLINNSSIFINSYSQPNQNKCSLAAPWKAGSVFISNQWKYIKEADEPITVPEIDYSTIPNVQSIIIHTKAVKLQT